MKNSIIWAFFLCLCIANAQTPTFTGKRIIKNTKEASTSKIHQEMKAKTSDFKIYELDLTAIDQHLKQSKKASSAIKIKLGNDHEWELHLTPHDVYAPDFRRTIQTATGLKTDYTTPEIFTYRGYNGTSSNKVTIALKKGWFYGHISEGKGVDFFIEPLSMHDSKSSKQRFLVYKTTDVTEDSYRCQQNRQPTEKEAINTNSSRVFAVQCAEIAVAYDQSMKNSLGGSSQVENKLTSRFNNVSQFYFDNFQIDKKIIEFYEAANNEITPDNNTTPCNEQFPNCADGTILDDFREWGQKENDPNSGFTSNPDAATFYTSRGVTSYYGYSHFEGICNQRGYNWVEDDIPFAETKKVTLWAHEFGHTWNAYHVNGSQYLMRSSISNTYPSQVASGTNTSIINHKNSRTCLATGSCTNSGCSNGDSATITMRNQTDCTLEYFVNNQSQGSIAAGQSTSKSTTIGASWVAKNTQGTTVDTHEIVCDVTSYTSEGSCGTTGGDPCNGGVTLTTTTGNLDDGSGSGNYGNNLDCSWLIKPSDGSNVTLTFNSFVTEANYDYVYVYDGENTSATQLGRFSGNNTPAALSSSNGALHVRFTTDSNTTAAGWSASYAKKGTSNDQCDGVAPYDSNTTYNVGDKVTYNGSLYQKTATSWTNLGRCGTTALSLQSVTLSKSPNTAFTVHPNPVSGNELFVSLKGNITGTYTILSMYGKVVASGALSNTIPIKGLTSGLYLLNIKTMNNTYTKRFIKQ